MIVILCDSCKTATADLFIGLVGFCSDCYDQVEVAVNEEISRNGPTDPLSDSCSTPAIGRNYRVPFDLVIAAELRAAEIRRRTGKNVNWSDVVRNILDSSFRLCPLLLLVLPGSL